MAENIVEILVKSTNDTRTGFESAKLDAEKAGEEAGQGFMSKFASFIGGTGGNGLSGVLSNIPVVGGALGPTGIYGLAGVVAAAGALLTEITGVVSGLVAAGLGVGSFALLALPVLKNVESAWQNVSGAQAAYNTAVEKQKLDPTKANAKAVADALLNLKAAQQQAGPTTSGIISEIQGVESIFSQMAKVFQPSVLFVLKQALGIVQDLLPFIGQFAALAAPGIEQFMSALSKHINSQQFRDIMSALAQTSGPAIVAIGNGLLGVAGGIGKLLTVMSSKDDVHAINIVFDIIIGLLNGFVIFIKIAMGAWDNLSRAIGNDVQTIGHWLGLLRGYFDETAKFFEDIPGRIEKAFSSLPPELQAIGRDAIDGFIHGLESIPIMGPALQIAGNLVSALRHATGSHSPSTVARAIGRDFTEGFRLGLTDTAVGVAMNVTGVGGRGPGGLGGGGVQVVFSGAGAANFQQLVRLLWPDLKLQVRTLGGGGTSSVQIALGQRA